MHVNSIRSFFLSLALLCFAVGCGHSGPPLGTVTGTVTMNGEPVAGLNLVFVPEEGGAPSYGGTDESGVYHLMFSQRRAGAALGTHHVLIDTRDPETDDSGTPIDSTSVVKIPGKYRQPGALTADVFHGHNEVDFELEADSSQTQNVSSLDSKPSRTN